MRLELRNLKLDLESLIALLRFEKVDSSKSNLHFPAFCWCFYEFPSSHQCVLQHPSFPLKHSKEYMYDDFITITSSLFQISYQVNSTNFKKEAVLQEYLVAKTLNKKWSFPLRISSVNLTKYAGKCGFGHIS